MARDPRSSVKFIAIFLVTILAVAAAYGALAYFINPRGDFQPNLFPNLLADSLREKQHLFLVFQTRRRVGGLLLGSSRAMKLDPADFERAEGVPFFNFAVNNAHMENMLSVYDWVRQQGAHPRFVVIGLDVEALHGDNYSDLKHDELARLQRSISDQEAHAPGLPERTVASAEAINNTFTVSYLDDMIRSVQIKANPALSAFKQQVFGIDGYEHYPKFEAERKAGTFDPAAEIAHVQEYYVTRFKTMTSLSERRKGFLERLISDAQHDGAQVTIWITPLHPLVVRNLVRTTPYAERLRDVRDYLRRLHARYGVATFDCSEPALFGGNERDWYDGAHMDENNAARVAQTILGRR